MYQATNNERLQILLYYYTFDTVLLQDNYQQQSQNRQRVQEFAIKHQCPATCVKQLTFIIRTRAM